MKIKTLTFCLFTFLIAAGAFGCQTASTNVSVNDPARKSPTANASTPATAAPADDAARITLADAKVAFDSTGVLFVDTRASAAFEAEHIKGAVNIPMDKLAEKFKDLPKNKKIIAYCS